MIILDVEQGSSEWFSERFGCVTGTRIQSAAGAKWDDRKNDWKLGDKKIQHTLLCELVSERMSNNEINDFKTKEMIRGNELEPFAIESAGKHRDIKFESCGMMVSESIKDFKYSPDAVHIENEIIIGGVETKAPNGKKHIEYMIHDEVPRKYFWQVIGPFIMSEHVKWWDFASYDDRNYERDLFIIRTNREDVEDIVNKARKEIESFLDMVSEVHAGLIF